MFESFNLDVRDFNVEHSAQVLGLFEPINAVMFLNVSDADFDTWRSGSTPDDELTETFCHEAYHCFQVFSTGFCFAHCLRLAEVFRRASFSPAIGRLVLARVSALVSDRVGGIAGAVLSPTARVMLAEARRLRAMARHAELITQQAQRSSQASIWGSLNPQLHASMNEVGETLRVRSGDGVSAEDVIEGAAFLYGRDAVAMTSGAVAELVDLEKQTAGPYQRLIAASLHAKPDCSSRGVRAASALALRYEQPGAAFVPLLCAITEATHDGDEKNAARTIAHALPSLPAAGAVLGTAAQYRANVRTQYSVYDRQLKRLDAWTIDELDLLVGVDALSAIPAGELGFTLVTRGGPRGPKDPESGYSAVQLAALVLPNGPSVAALRHDLRQAIAP